MQTNIKIVIIHYNTPKLTGCLIDSINKHTRNAQIYVFDNSNKHCFINVYDNVTVFDNTKGTIIDFNKELKKYKNTDKSLGRFSGFGSFKHCISVDKCFDLVNDNFVLLDSDVLLKKDIRTICDESKIFVGEIVHKRIYGDKYPEYPVTPRVLPFMCYINVKKCKENGIRYFNGNYMGGLCYGNNVNESYDTGCYFLKETVKYKYKEIKLDDYIIHFKGGSYSKTGSEKITADRWLEKHSALWKDNMKRNRIKNKKVVYTCISGSYDSLKEPLFVNPDFDYICFTDNKDLKSNVWDIRPIPNELSNYDNTRRNRNIKILPHKYLKEYDISIYIDGNITIKSNMNSFLNEYIKNNEIITLYKHPKRKCLYKEMEVCKKIKKDNAECIDRQKEYYLNEGFPEDFGLSQNNIIIRRHNNPTCIKIMEEWWSQLVKFSKRDQLSLFYVLWKNKDSVMDKLHLSDKQLDMSNYFIKAIHGNGSKQVTQNVENNTARKVIGDVSVVSKRIMAKSVIRTKKRADRKIISRLR